ncbi:hypothetical protein KIP16_04190 [Limosilactobacillus fermentum]|jgi:hypothetical protein|uniref:Uncharacterized protein n=1 Tax=Limosilactobacillus fermentum TaxID=1613 RepID=A0A2K2TGC4_LIMFE|nr:relaxase MobL [Limosilactobacillus fermentum]MBS7688145.1 hypothetical protein [Limosilactobacillus fermentum]MCT3442374.1 hypothetical protein [Limosilactobacillus fermentum]MCT3452247.1 hypothetical protein [Limosilactobacillus fermentum]PNV57034.1 hypothetical protein C1Y38_10705 [Limosilactobacillus fermentum]SPE16690.1 hypothetical protein LAF9269_01732 [Limosilactobacillus fermentum]
MTTVMKKSGAESPDIIYSQGFRLANAGGNGGLTYLDYTERDEAVADELSPEEMFEDDELLSDLRNDPDLPEDFEGYLGYTDRDAAAKLENLIDSYQEKRYPTFSQGSYELTEAEHNRLINNLKTAQVNETVLWYGVISFSPEFIREAGLIDENNQVNQRAIKSAVMRSMPEMLQNEALDNNETFWWADIHLNTDHVHVHVAISQTENTRPEKDGQPLGMFSETTFRNFKAGIHRELSSDRSRSRVREIQQDLDQINKVLPGKAVEEARNNRQQMELLRRIQAALPNYKDKRRWRASNHSKEFQKAQKLTDELVDSLLDNQLKDEYTNFKQLVEERDQMYRQAYGQRIKDTTKAKDERLRTLIKNRIYRSLKDIADEVTPDDDRGKTKENNSDLMSRIEALGPEKNAQLLEAEQRRLKTLDPKSLEAKELKKVIGFRKFYIRRVNLDAEIDYHNHMYQELQKINSGSKKSEQEMQQFFLQAHQEQARLAWLKKQPHYMLKKQDPDGEFEALNNKYFDVTQVPINKLTPQMVKARKKQLAKELGFMLENPDSPITNHELPNPNSDYGVNNAVEYYRSTQQVLDLKLKISQNNQQYKNNPTMRNELNRPLFQELRDHYQRLGNSEKIDKAIDRRMRFVKQQQDKAVSRVSKGGRVLRKLQQALNSIGRGGRSDIRALSRHLDDDQELAMEEAKEDQEIEIEIEAAQERERGMER